MLLIAMLIHRLKFLIHQFLSNPWRRQKVRIMKNSHTDKESPVLMSDVPSIFDLNSESKISHDNIARSNVDSYLDGFISSTSLES
jgi:hypothetical protein